MIIADDSPLRHLPPTLDAVQRMFLDGIRYSIEMADVAYERLRETALAVAANSQARTALPPRSAYPSILLDAWGIIDAVNRLRVLIEKMPSLERGPYLRAFLATTAPVKSLRDSVQHLDERIRDSAEQGRSTWGSVSWMYVPDVKQGRAWLFSIVAGSIAPGVHNVPNPIGLNAHVPIGLLILEAHGVSVILSDVMTSVRNVAGTIEAMVANAHEGDPKGGADLLISFELHSPNDEEKA